MRNVLLGFLLSCFCGIALAAGVQLQASANLLSAPNITASKVATLTSGTTVAVLKTDTSNGYTQVETNNHLQGWVPSATLPAATPTTPALSEEMKQPLFRWVTAPHTLALWQWVVGALVVFWIGRFVGGRRRSRKQRLNLFL